MKLPRLSIAWIMAVIIVVAADLAAGRALVRTGLLLGVLVAFGTLPMATMLVLGIPSLVRVSREPGKSRPFLMGFEAVGWAVLLAYTGGAVLSAESVAGSLEWVGWVIEFIPVGLRDTILGEVLFMLLILLPQLAAAPMGGWLNRKFKVRISIERRRASGLEADGPSRERLPVAARSLGSSACRSAS